MTHAPLEGIRGAIVHDWFQGMHGSERVVEAILADVFPRETPPDVFTFTTVPGALPEHLERAIVQESRLARLPGIRQTSSTGGRWRYLLPLMPRYFRSLDLSQYDVVVASSHACAVHVRPPVSTPFVCYCYTPMRYAWLPDLERERATGLSGWALRTVAGRLRKWDLEASARPDAYIAISEAVRRRIGDFYERDAVVIYPPVDVQDFRADGKKEPGLFLWVQRLVPYKRPDLVIDAFRGLAHRLVMVGVGPLEASTRSQLPENVELRGWLERSELARLFERASGFIHVAEEDFGISMVESLAAGTPVIALRNGGGGEIVRDGTDGLLIDRPDTDSLRDAVRRLATQEWDREILVRRAREFSRDTFVGRMQSYLEELQVAKQTDRVKGTQPG
jgi:glycosyltransferase involved in cell wall biosynthesis